MWFLFAVASALLWSAGTVLMKRGLEHTTPWFNNLLAAVIGLPLNAGVAILGGVSLHDFGLSLVLAIATDVGLVLYPYALAKGPVSVTGTLMGCYPIPTILLSVFLLGEGLNPLQDAAIGLVLCGVIALSYPVKSALARWRPSWVVWGLLAACTLGVADFIAKIGVGEAGVYTFLLALALAQLPSMVVVTLADRSGRRVPPMTMGHLLPTILGTFSMVAGGVTLDLAFAGGEASLVSPVTSSYVGLAAVLAVALLGERLTPRQAGAVVMTAVGVVVLGAAR